MTGRSDVSRATARTGVTDRTDLGSDSYSDLRGYARALRQLWRSTALVTLLGLGVAIALTYLAEPTYQSHVSFFVVSTTDASNSPLQADQFVQRRVNSYVGVVNSERMARVIIQDTGLDLTVEQVSTLVSANADPETVLLNVTVTDTSTDRSLSIARSIAGNLDSLIAQLDNRGNRAAVQLRVISGPTLDPDPVTPRRKVNLAMGLLVGLGLGVAQALIRRGLDTTVRTKEQLEAQTGLPVLGELHFDQGAVAAPILTQRDGSTPRAEAVRQLRTNLRFADAAGQVKVLVVTSAREKEGKSTAASNLAVSVASGGRTVLLIDGDLRQPRLDQYFDLEREAGLTSVLIGEADLASVAQEWGPDGLHVLTSGPVPPNPSELLGSHAMELVVEQARANYDLVIIDSPPLIPVTDAALASVLADGVLLTVRYGKTNRHDVSDSLESLSAVNARVLGIVLSFAPTSRQDRRSSYYGDHRSGPQPGASWDN